MARKSGNESSRRSLSTSHSGRTSSAGTMNEHKDAKDYFMEIISNPAFKYVAGGIATAMLARLASNMSDKYPELSQFIRDNIDMFEGRLDNYKQSFQESIRH